ncbi:trypsin-like peptidase domain-containing protein [Oceaniglobus indicus]|uniref:trypsin-like peptidase domain-containing protein n=1 Tax=Oceaniglobus indicus TaxID=2047749 RepID=UPI001F4EF896|nr:trypsin-like peptidase domain-containing protein [Oceaniglobus indicus]
MQRSRLTNRLASVALIGALSAGGAMTVLPVPAFAVPAGGYGDLVEAVSPSVVFIEVTAAVSPAAADPSDMLEGMPDELKRRFGDMFKDRRGGPARPARGVGSGFIISEDGTIVTNAHVVDGAEEVNVKLADGRSFTAEVIGTDPLTDIAVLRVDAGEDLPAIKFGSSDTMRPGDEVVAVGNPFGLGGTVTSGIVSATSRNINSGPFDDFIQTDAAINRGNSGGPLFNNAGEVIGVNTAIFSPDGGSVGIGFAVPSDLVKTIVADLQDDGEITRGWLGVQIKPMPEDIASVLGYDTPKGAVVEDVVQDSPADKAGLVDGDIILSFDGTEIVEVRDLTRVVASTAPDKTADMVVLHKGQEKTLSVTIGALAKKEA